MKYNFDYLLDKVEKYKNVDLNMINIDDVFDIEQIKINKRKSSKERILDFLNDVENPYVFKYKGRLVKIGFSDTDRTAEECLSNVISNLYR